MSTAAAYQPAQRILNDSWSCTQPRLWNLDGVKMWRLDQVILTLYRLNVEICSDVEAFHIGWLEFRPSPRISIPISVHFRSRQLGGCD